MPGLVVWRFWFESESGLTEESGDEIRLAGGEDAHLPAQVR